MTDFNTWLGEGEKDADKPFALGAFGDARTPDDAASDLEIGRTLGQPPQAVLAYRDQFAQAAEVARNRQRVSRTPRLRDWLERNPDHYAVARDDIETLSQFEDRPWLQGGADPTYLARARLYAANTRTPLHMVLRGLVNNGDPSFHAMARLEAAATGQPLRDVQLQMEQARYAPSARGRGDAWGQLLDDIVMPPARLFGLAILGDLPDEHMGALGRFARRTHTTTPLSESHRQGLLDEEFQILTRRAMAASEGDSPPLTTQEQARLNFLRNRPGQEDWGAPVFGPAVRMWPQIVGSFREAGQRSWERGGEVRPDDQFRYGVLRGLAAETVLLPASAIATAGGFVEGFGGYIYDAEAGTLYDELIQQGIAPEIAAARAHEHARFATAVEFFSDITFMRALGVSRLLENLFTPGVLARPGAGMRFVRGAGLGAWQQGREELFQEISNVAHADLARQDDQLGRVGAARLPRLSEVFSPEAIHRYLEATIIGMEGGFAMAGGVHSLHLAMEVRAVRRAQVQAENFERVIKASQASRTAARSPSTFESAVGAMDESQVYIDADAFVEHFQQQGIDPYAAAVELGVGEQQLAQALSSSAQIQIPTAVFAARVVRNPTHAPLAQHARAYPGDYSQAELARAGEVIAAQFERVTQEAEAYGADAQAVQAFETMLRENIGETHRPEVARKLARFGAALPIALLAHARAALARGEVTEDYVAGLEQNVRRLFGEGMAVVGADAPQTGGAQSMMQAPAARIAELMAATLPLMEAVRPGDFVSVDGAPGEVVRPAQAGEPMIVRDRASGQERAVADDAAVAVAPAEQWGAQARSTKMNDVALRFGSEAEVAELHALAEARASVDDLFAHPIMLRVADHSDPTTTTVPWTIDNDTARDAARRDAFMDGRTYAGGLNLEQAVEALIEMYAAGAGPEGPLHNRQAIIVIGHPGAGKSTFIRAFARATRSAVADADGSKELIQEYEGGYNTQQVHNESSALRTKAVARLVAAKTNLIIERVGDTAESVIAERDGLAAQGYGVRLVHVHVQGGEAVARQILRFIGHGRHIWPRYARMVMDRIAPAFEALLEQNAFSEYIEVDANPPPGQARLTRAQGAQDLQDAITDLTEAGGDAVRHRHGRTLGSADAPGRTAPSGKDGLGQDLDPAARLARAIEAGFTTPAFHATFEDFTAFRPGAHFGTTNAARRRLADKRHDVVAGEAKTRADYQALRDDIDALITEHANDKRLIAFGRDKRYAERHDALYAKLRAVEAQIAAGMEGARTIPVLLKQGKAGEVWAIDRDRWGSARYWTRMADEAERGNVQGHVPSGAERAFWSDVAADPQLAAWDEGRESYTKDDLYALLARHMEAHGYTYFSYRNDIEGGVSFLVPDPKNIRSVHAQFDPARADSADLLAQNKRGRIDFTYADWRHGAFGDVIIRMGEASDLSTFLHEFSHLAHLMLESIASDPQAPSDLKAMWASTLDWFGVTQDEWDALGFESKREYFEMWARTFEAYLMEGKAPSLGLMDVFATFASWLKQAYHSIFRLDHNLNPQIRDVFDRLLASDAEIAQARAVMGADFAWSREAFRTDAEFEAYQAARVSAREAMEADVRARAMDAHVRKHKRWWRSERERVRPTATIDVDSDTARRAYEWLAYGLWRDMPAHPMEEGDVAPDPALAKPEDLPEMTLDVSGMTSAEIAALPEGLRPLASEEDVDAALANAMALKRQGRARQPRRLAAFIKAQGGIKDEGGEVRQALGTARARPGLINNATGKTADELALAAWEAGYFGAKPKKQGLGQSLGPVFASALASAIENSATQSAPASQWLATIRRAPGVKREEVEWTGVDTWLEALGAEQVSREDVLAFVRENGVRVEESVLGAGHINRSEIDAAIDEIEQARGTFADFAEYGDENHTLDPPEVESFTSTQTIDGEEAELTVDVDRFDSESKDPSEGGWINATVTFPDGRQLPHGRWVEHTKRRGWLLTTYKRGELPPTDKFTDAEFEAATNAIDEIELEENYSLSEDLAGASADFDSYLDDAMRALRAGDIEGARRFLEYAGEMERKWVDDPTSEALIDTLPSERNTTKYEQYTLPIGENYRELLLTLPPMTNESRAISNQLAEMARQLHEEFGERLVSTAPPERLAEYDALGDRQEALEKAATYRSSHFDQPNILAHVRFNERVDAEGRRTLFIEEVQSDWHQAGRERGYRNDAEIQRIRQKLIDTADIDGMTVDAVLGQRGASDAAIERIRAALTPEELQTLYDASGTRQVPDAPFKNNAWASLAMKRMIRWAAENGFEQIAWTRGQHQIERFDLARQISGVSYVANANGTYSIRAFGVDKIALPSRPELQNLSPEQMAQVLGKDTANMVVEGRGQRLHDGQIFIPVTGMSVGGEGMRAFYDRILVNIANDLGKKFGARVGETTIDTSRAGDATTTTVHALPISPVMKEAVTSKPQSLFQDRPRFVFRGEDDMGKRRYDLPLADGYAADLTVAKDGVVSWRVRGPQGWNLDGLPARERARIALGAMRGVLAALRYDTENYGREIYRFYGAGDARQSLYRELGGLAPQYGYAFAEVEEGSFELRRTGEHPGFSLFQDPDAERRPTPRELLDALIDDLKNIRQVYSVDDADALGDFQDRADALRWFDSRGIDLSKSKEEIRAQLVEALAREQARENAVPADDIAPWFGFSSGDEMLQAIRGLKPRNQAIEDNIDARVEGKWGDPVADGSLQAEAELAAHAEAQARTIELELEAIQRLTNGRRGPVGRAAKAMAEDAVANMTVAEIRNFEAFLAGERRAAKAAFEAMEKGDIAEASLYKQRQLASFWMYRKAREAAERLDKIGARWRKYSSNQTTRTAIGSAHIEQIDAILGQIETGKPKFTPGQSLDEWAAALAEEGNEDLLVFNPEALGQQIKRPLASMTWTEIQALDDALRNIETIGRGMIKLRKEKYAQRIAAIVQGLKARIQTEWAERLARRVSLVAPNASDKIGLELRNADALLWKQDYLARMLDGYKDGGPWMAIMADVQEAENDLAVRSQAATQGFLALVRRHYDKRQFQDMLSRRLYIDAIEDNRTKAQLIGVALHVGNEYNRTALLRGEGWSDAQLHAVLSRLDKNDWAFVQGLWDFVAQFKEESFALDERTRGSRPADVIAQPFTAPDGTSWAGGYWPVKFDSRRSTLAAEREAKATVIGEYGAGFRQAATNRSRLKGRVGTKGQPLSDDWMSILATHVHDSLRDITHRELIITLRRVKADPELRSIIERAAGPDAVKVLDAWVFRLAVSTPANVFGDYGKAAAYLRRQGTAHAMGFKVSVAVLNLLGHFQAIPRNGLFAQLKQAGLSVAAGFPDLVRKHLQAIATGEREVTDRVRFVHEKSEMMRNRSNSFDRDIAEVKGDMVGRRPGSILPKQIEDMLQILNAYTDQVVAVPTWLAAYESAVNGKVKGVDPANDDAAVDYADSVVRMAISAGATKDLAAAMASNNQWQRLLTMFMGWANTFYNQLFHEQFPGVMSGKIPLPQFAANMAWIWLLPAVITMIFYGQHKRDDDEDDAQYWTRMSLMGAIYPLQTIPLIRDAMSSWVVGYKPQTPVTAIIDRGQKFINAWEREDARQIVKQGYFLGGQLFGLPAQLYTTGDYIADWAMGEEDPMTDPADALEEALLRDTR